MSDLLLPLPQSGEYARALDLLGVPVRTLRQTCGGQDRLLWQVQSRRFGPLGRVDMISRGLSPMIRQCCATGCSATGAGRMTARCC